MADRFRTPRKEKLWAGVPGISAAISVAGTTVGGGFAFTSPQTVLRMLGEYTLVAAPTPTADDFCVITVALGKVSSDAATLGATAVPDPAGEPEYPWLYWAAHPMYFGAAAVDGASASNSVRQTFDIRSMRKFKARESLLWVIEYSDLNGTPSIRMILGQTRILTTLH